MTEEYGVGRPAFREALQALQRSGIVEIVHGERRFPLCAAEQRSLTKAALASHIGLAAASRHMALLEHRFNTVSAGGRGRRGHRRRGVGLETHPYRTDCIAVVMQADHPLASVPDMKFTDILDVDLIALEWGSSMMRLLAAQERAANCSVVNLVDSLVSCR